MKSESFVIRFILHTLWALAVFSSVMLAMELIVPGSVAPYLDPIPLAIISLIGLSVDGTLRKNVDHGWKKIPFWIIPTILMIGMIVFGVRDATGRTGAFAIWLMIAIVIITAWISLGNKEREGNE